MLRSALIPIFWLELAVLALCGTASSSAAHSESRQGVRLSYQNPQDGRYAEGVFKAYSSARRSLEAMGWKVPAIEIKASLNAQDFKNHIGAGKDVAAITDKEKSIIYTQRLGALEGRKILDVTIRHEVFHAAQPKHLPHWLAEGLARIFTHESASDSQKTGLETISYQKLNSYLLRQDPDTIQAAYKEASKRAATTLSKEGWNGIAKNALGW